LTCHGCCVPRLLVVVKLHECPCHHSRAGGAAPEPTLNLGMWLL
jgi:hypothetical protein